MPDERFAEPNGEEWTERTGYSKNYPLRDEPSGPGAGDIEEAGNRNTQQETRNAPVSDKKRGRGADALSDKRNLGKIGSMRERFEDEEGIALWTRMK